MTTGHEQGALVEDPRVRINRAWDNSEITEDVYLALESILAKIGMLESMLVSHTAEYEETETHKFECAKCFSIAQRWFVIVGDNNALMLDSYCHQCEPGGGDCFEISGHPALRIFEYARAVIERGRKAATNEP